MGICSHLNKFRYGIVIVKVMYRKCFPNIRVPLLARQLTTLNEDYVFLHSKRLSHKIICLHCLFFIFIYLLLILN